MRVTTTEEVQDLLQAFIDSAALGAALERGLFWELAEEPQTALEVALGLLMPLRRCRYWLDLLVRLGLLTCEGDRYAPSAEARGAILEAYSRETWACDGVRSKGKLVMTGNVRLNFVECGTVPLRWAGVERWPQPPPLLPTADRCESRW